MDEINVLYCFDNKFWMLAAVSIQSLMSAHAGTGTQITVHCMVPPRTRGRRQIAKIIHGQGGRMVWRVVHRCENPFQTHNYLRWSPVIFYRLFAHKIFPELDKILYLDSDTLICGDLRKMYNTDISHHVIAAVPDMAPVDNPEFIYAKHITNFRTKYMDNGTYFNSGVLLINTKNIAKHMDLLLNFKQDLQLPDQDIINAALDGKICPLPLRYNIAPGAPIPSHMANITPTQPTIMHFYTSKPYEYDYTQRDAYAKFSRHAAEIGMTPEQIKKHERKYGTHTIKPGIFGIKITDNTVRLFGIKIYNL